MLFNLTFSNLEIFEKFQKSHSRNFDQIPEVLIKFPKFWSNSRNSDQIPEIFPEIDVRSFLPNFTEFPVRTEFTEFPVIPTEFNNLVCVHFWL